jgi:hypothetical protein
MAATAEQEGVEEEGSGWRERRGAAWTGAGGRARGAGAGSTSVVRAGMFVVRPR